MFGEPGQGFHEKRIGKFALNDILGTLGLAFATSAITNTGYTSNLIGWLAAAEALHYQLGVRTAFLTSLGITFDCD